jgi:hypothetical protein
MISLLIALKRSSAASPPQAENRRRAEAGGELLYSSTSRSLVGSQPGRKPFLRPRIFSIERQVELEDIDPRLAREAKLTALRGGVDESPHIRPTISPAMNTAGREARNDEHEIEHLKPRALSTQSHHHPNDGAAKRTGKKA